MWALRLLLSLTSWPCVAYYLVASPCTSYGKLIHTQEVCYLPAPNSFVCFVLSNSPSEYDGMQAAMEHSLTAKSSLLDLCTPAINRLNVYMIMFLNLFTDIYLIMIPIPMLLGAQIARARKAGLVVIFSGGIFVIVAGLLRSIFILQVRCCHCFLISEVVPGL